MQKFELGSVTVDVRATGLEIRDHSADHPPIAIPLEALTELVEFLTYHADRKATEQRRSFRLTLDPGDLTAQLVTDDQITDVIPLDISLGGMAVTVDDSLAKRLKVGERCRMDFDAGGVAVSLTADVVRCVNNVVAVAFPDCEGTDGELAPPPELARIYADLQRHWLAKRIKR